MVNERIVETILNSSSKLVEIILVKVINKSRNNFIVQHLVHESGNSLILHAVTYDIKTGQICTKNKSCVSTVKNTNFTMLVRHYVRNNMYIYTGFLERKSVLKAIRSFNYPNAKDLTYIDKFVVVAVLSLKLFNFLRITNTSRYDSVYKGRAEDVFFINPCLETILKIPEVDVLVNAFKKLFSVIINKLAGEYYNAFLACLISSVKNLC